MNNIARQTLRQILDKYGKEICSDARRCEGLLNDLCGSYRREINVLTTAIEERIPLDLLAGAGSIPLELLLNRLEKRLEEQTALTAEAARWAVESWALALKLTTESEIHTRHKRIESAKPTISKTETVQPTDATGRIPNSNRSKPPAPKSPTPAPQKQTYPPSARRQPTQAPQPSPPVIFPTGNQPVNHSPVQPHTANQSVPARKGFGIFRGCLFVIFLLAVTSIALFLGVPYAINVMRETQRERNNEPPRFPVR
jgi:hypothetical protein